MAAFGEHNRIHYQRDVLSNFLVKRRHCLDDRTVMQHARFPTIGANIIYDGANLRRNE